MTSFKMIILAALGFIIGIFGISYFSYDPNYSTSDSIVAISDSSQITPPPTNPITSPATGSSSSTNSSLSQNNIYPTEASNTLPLPLHRPELSTFYHAFQSAEFGNLFQGTGPFTVFAPTNEAFEKLPKGKWEELLSPENKDKLIEILTYYIVPGRLKAKTLKTERLQTLNGKFLNITVENNEIKVNDSRLIKTDSDLQGPNLIVHEIDKVLFPE